MSLKIRVTTKRELFELRKQQHTQLGYRIEDEQPVPVCRAGRITSVSLECPALLHVAALLLNSYRF